MGNLLQSYFDLTKENLELALNTAEKLSKTFGNGQNEEKSLLESWSSVIDDITKFYFLPGQLFGVLPYQKNPGQKESLNFLDDRLKGLNDYTVRTFELSDKVWDHYLQAVNIWNRYSLKAYDNWLSTLKIWSEEKQEASSLNVETKQQSKRPDLKGKAEEKQVPVP
ncbi:MAG: hypothetical protein STSR0004_20610 [Peptococcaceae bacterium]